MIIWNDFIFDKVLGPVLLVPELNKSKKSKKFDNRNAYLGDRSVMDDAYGKPTAPKSANDPGNKADATAC